MSINAQPFSPSFKLVDTLQDGQILIFDVSENAFVNAYGDGSGANTTPVTTVLNLGTGISLSDGVTGNALELKTLVAGSGITITDNTDSIVITANAVDQIQSATNLGTGAGVLASITVDDNFEFKSIAGGSGIGITDNGSTITISVDGSLGQGVYLEIDSNLSDLTDISAARNTLDVYSKTEVAGKFVRTDGHSIPDYDKTWDIGSPTKRFNDIYGETFQGTAVLANNLTVAGNVGDLLAYDGTKWIPVSPVAGGNVTPQLLALDGTTLTISGGNTIDLDFVEADIEGLVVEEVGQNLLLQSGWSFMPTDDSQQALGTPTHRWSEVYLSNASVYIDDNILSSDGTTLLWNGEVVQTGTIDLSSISANVATIEDVQNATVSLASILYVDNEISNALDLYATTAYVDGRFTDLLGAAPEALDTLKELSDALGGDANFATTVTNQLSTKANTADLANVATTGDYNDLSNKPTIPTVPTNVSAFTNDAGYLVAADISTLSSTTYVDNAVAGLASETFVTDAIATATTDFATELFVTNAVSAAVANVIDLAPETLDTLNELAAAIGDDANFVTTVNTALSNLQTAINTEHQHHIDGDATLQTNIDALANSLATVATTGEYSDLANTPTNLSDFANDTNYITLASISATGDISYDNLTGVISYTAPTTVSSFTNDAGYLVAADIANLSSTTYVDDAIANATAGLATEVYVTNAVSAAVANVVDLAPETLDTLNELAAAIGDDANFVTTVNTALTNLQTAINTEHQHHVDGDAALQANIDALSNSLATVATTGNYSDLNGVPTNVSTFTNDANYITLNSLSATGDISYDANTGTFSYTAPTDISQLTDNTNLLADIDGLTSDSANSIVYLDAGWHFLPSTDIQQDLGSLSNRFRDLYLSGNTIYMEEATLSTDGLGNLFFNGKDVFDFAYQKNKPTNLSQFVNDKNFVSDAQVIAQIQSDLGNLQVDYATITGLPDLSVYETTANVDAKIANVLGNISTTTLDTIGELADAINNDPDYFNTISGGLDAKANTADLSTVATTGSYNDLADLPIATAIERFKVNYATDGSIQSISDATGGVVATVTSPAGGLVEFTFTGYDYPPTGILIYGYARSTNEYVITPVTADMTTRKLAGGGTAGAPEAFGNLGSNKLTLKLAEADTGASRSFGTTTHAWVMFTMIA